MAENHNSSIIFFDGICNLCNGFVDFMITRDTSRQFMYASLQDEKSHDVLAEYGEEFSGEISTVILLHEGKLYKKSEAVGKIFKTLGGVWGIISIIIRIVPTSISDYIYDFISSRRYRLLGKRSTCRIPTEDESALFL